jgi:hypothetical protein
VRRGATLSLGDGATGDMGEVGVGLSSGGEDEEWERRSGGGEDTPSSMRRRLRTSSSSIGAERRGGTGAPSGPMLESTEAI